MNFIKQYKQKLKTKKILLTILLITLIILIFTGYNLLVKKDFRTPNLSDETIEVNTKYKETNPKICYGSVLNCKELKYKKTGKINNKKLGTYTIKYKVNYKTKTKIFTRQIIVKDTTKPKIVVGTDKLVVCPNGTPLNEIIKAIDNYDGDLTSKIKIKHNGKLFTYIVQDSSGNTTAITKQAEINDNIKPVIKLKGEKETYLAQNTIYKEKGAIAQDSCDGDITDNIKITGNVDTRKKGKYQINYEATDKAGNKATKTRIIKVVDKKDIIKPNGKTIYLTFDDGPGKDTNKLLDILKKYNVKATFFVTKNVKDYKEVLKREHEEGHTIGLHTWSHSYSIYRSEKTYFYDLYKIENEVYKITGYKANIIRFPGGSSNTISKDYKKGIMSILTKEVEKKGYKYFDWNVYSGDAGETQNTNEVAKNVIRTLNQGKTNVVLQHDIHDYSVNAVEKIIQYGLKKGYKFAPITENTPQIKHHVNN